jgi:hypothetical protein
MSALTATKWRVEEANTAYAHAASSGFSLRRHSNIRLHRKRDHGSEASPNPMVVRITSTILWRPRGKCVGNVWRLGAGDPLISTRSLLGLTSSALLLPCLAFSSIYRARFHINFIGYIIVLVENGMAESWQCLDSKVRAYTWRHAQPVLRSRQSTVVYIGNGV